MKIKFKRKDYLGPSNQGWVYNRLNGKKAVIKASAEFSNEPWSAQVFRAEYKIRNNVDIWNDVFGLRHVQPIQRKGKIIGFTTDHTKDKTFMGQKVLLVANCPIDSWVTKVSEDKTKRITGRVIKHKDDCCVVQVFENGQEIGNKKWPNDREVVLGKLGGLSLDEKRVAELKELHQAFGYIPTSPTQQDILDYESFGVHIVSKSTEAENKPPQEKKGNKAKGKDKYGFRLGTRASAVNEAMTYKYQSMQSIMKKAKWTTPIHGHLDHLVKKKIAKIKIINGVKMWRLRKDHPVAEQELGV